MKRYQNNLAACSLLVLPMMSYADTYRVTKDQDSTFSSFITVQEGDTLEVIAVQDTEYGIVQVRTDDGRTGTLSLDFLEEIAVDGTTETMRALANPAPQIDGEPVFVCNINSDLTNIRDAASLTTGRVVDLLENNREIFIINDVDNSDGSRFFEIRYWKPTAARIETGFIQNSAVRRECYIQGLVADLKGPFERTDGYCYFTVASRRSEYEAGVFADTLSSISPSQFEVFQTNTGWLAITLGLVLETDFETNKTRWDVPDDSFCSDGAIFQQPVRNFCQQNRISCGNGNTVRFANCETAGASASLSFLSWGSETGEFLDTRDAFCAVGGDLTVQSYEGQRRETGEYVFNAQTQNERVVVSVDQVTRNVQMRWPDRRTQNSNTSNNPLDYLFGDGTVGSSGIDFSVDPSGTGYVVEESGSTPSSAEPTVQPGITSINREGPWTVIQCNDGRERKVHHNSYGECEMPSSFGAYPCEYAIEQTMESCF